MQKYNQERFSWGVVILLLFLFFPVGIPLLAVKVTSEKTRYSQNARVMKILGILFAIIGAIMLVMTLAGKVEAEERNAWFGVIAVLILLFVGGLSLLIAAHRLAKKGVRYQRYPAIIASQNGGRLQEIADKVPTTLERAKKEIQQMVDDGWIPGAYLDHTSCELILPKAAAENRVCPNCGAAVVAEKGKRGVCEYCKLPL